MMAVAEKRIQRKRTNDRVMEKLNDAKLGVSRFDAAAEVIAEEMRRVFDMPEDEPIIHPDPFVLEQTVEFTEIRTRLTANTYSPNGYEHDDEE